MSDSTLVPGGPPPAEPNTLSALMAAGQTALPGSPVYSESDGTLGVAEANSATTAYPNGLSLQPAGPGVRCHYRYSGPLTLTSAEWTAVLNTGTELVPGKPYYVSQSSPGKITNTAPGSGIVSAVGVAVSPLCMLINPNYHTAGS